jgi:phosphoribosylformimino-5-aminoimidazole carboxamide ribonucleotide (ProFAR) isomerase
VPFSVLPAIDVAGGRLAVWTPAGPRPLDAFGGDPAAAARAYAAAGAAWVHLVDMDRALRRTPGAVDLVAAVRAEGLAVQASGGVVDARTVEDLLGAGAARVVLASAALGDEAAVAELVARHGPRLLVGLEIRDGRIVARGPVAVDLEPLATVGWLVAAGAAGFVVTALGRVGTLAGPDVGSIRRVARSGRPVLAAGGISSVEDLRRVRDAGAVGAVVGRAALEGDLDLEAALRWARGARRWG